MSRTEEKGPAAWRGQAGLAVEPVKGSGPDRTSSVKPCGLELPPEAPCSFLYDEAERTRLMADLTRLLREPTMPRTARLAGITLIGWLARRRPDEAPHAVGIAEARESERRMQSARSKAR